VVSNSFGSRSREVLQSARRILRLFRCAYSLVTIRFTDARCRMQGAQRTHCTLCESCPTCAARRIGRLQSQRTVNARSNVGSRAADSSRFSGHFSGCLHTNTTSHSIAASVTTAIPRKDGKHALEATSDCGAYTTECDTYASRHARKSSFVYPGLHGTAFGKHCSSQTAQQFTYAMLSAPPSQLRSFAQVSEHGLGTSLPPAFFSIKPTHRMDPESRPS
jgi:hypothetical protein